MTIHCFFSGGRDSALACYIAFQVAKRRGWDFRLVHIDTTIGLRETKEYVKRYAEWLGAELIVLRPDYTFEEYVARYSYWPHSPTLLDYGEYVGKTCQGSCLL